MNMNNMFNKAESYKTPAIELLEAEAEAVLCVSEVGGTGTIEDLTGGDFQW